tara:strand:+ start:61 stop:561 length:501 start_codon:yes stop_codon:yes gene_type:complete
MWLVSENNSIAMSVLPKNGSTSISNVFGPSRSVNDRSIFNTRRRVAWIRNPLSRLISAYSFFKALDNQGVLRDRSIVVTDWPSFVDHALATQNMHWCRQIFALTLDGIYAPTEAYRFEDISSKWEMIMGAGLLPWNNAATTLPVTDYRQADIETYYSEDFALWQSL